MALLTEKSGRKRPRSGGTRAAILAAAERSFAESGLAGARTDAIAAAAGVNKAMLYYHFKSKDDLYHSVIEDHFVEFNREALKLLAGPGSARAVLLRYVGLHFDMISARHRYACLYQQLVLSGGPHLERLVRRHFAPRTAAMHRLLERGIRAGEFRRVDPMHAGISIAALIVFYFSAAEVLRFLGHHDAYSPANLARRKKEVLAFIRHGLFTHPNAPVS